MANASGGSGDDRRIDLSAVKSRRRNLKDPYLSVSFDEYFSNSTKKATRIIADVGEFQGVGRRPTQLMICRSETNPKDLIAVPTSVDSDSNTRISWVRQGTMARVELDKILAREKITVPVGSRMYIKIYMDEDPQFGKVIGMMVNSAEFEVIETREPRETDSSADKSKRKGKADKGDKEKKVPDEPKPDGDSSTSAAAQPQEAQDEENDGKSK